MPWKLLETELHINKPWPLEYDQRTFFVTKSGFQEIILAMELSPSNFRPGTQNECACWNSTFSVQTSKNVNNHENVEFKQAHSIYKGAAEGRPLIFLIRLLEFHMFMVTDTFAGLHRKWNSSRHTHFVCLDENSKGSTPLLVRRAAPSSILQKHTNIPLQVHSPLPSQGSQNVFI